MGLYGRISRFFSPFVFLSGAGGASGGVIKQRYHADDNAVRSSERVYFPNVYLQFFSAIAFDVLMYHGEESGSSLYQ